MVLALSLDASVGIVIAYLLSHAWDIKPSLLAYGVGMIAAILPDVSIVALSVLSGKENIHHRDLTHYPLLIIPLFVVIAWFSLFWATLITLCLLAHFIDDTTDPGGIKWLAPFSKRRFQVLAREPLPLSREQWLEKYYLRPTIKSVAAITLSVIAAALVIWQLWSSC